MKRVIFNTLAIVFCYAFVASLCWDLNPDEWGGWGRLTFIVSLFLALSLAFILSIPKEAFVQFNKNLQAKREEANQAEAEANRKKGGFAGLLQKQLDTAEEARKAQS